MYESDTEILIEAFIRFIFFIGIAGVISLLASTCIKSEAKFQEHSKFLQILIDTLPIPIFHKDTNDHYTGCNAAFEEFFGKKHDEIIGKSAYDLWSKELADKYHQDDIALFSSLHTQKYEGFTEHADGTLHDVVFYKAPLFDKKNNLTGLVGAISDLTYRKRAEEAVKESEKHYRSLFENMNEGCAYCKMIYDEQGVPIDWVYVDVNNAFEYLTGLKDTKGKRVSEVIPGIREQVPELFKIYNHVVLTGIPNSFEFFFTPLQIWFHLSIYSPREGHFVAVFDNITDRKNAEERFRELFEQYEMILENVPAIIIFKDIHNRFIKVNPSAARIMEKTIDEIEGKTFSDIFPGIDDPFLQDDLKVITTKKPIFGSIHQFTFPERENLWVQTDRVPLLDDSGKVIAILHVSTDITESKLAKDAITLANKKLNLLSSITRHDVNNKILIILGYLELMQYEELNSQIKEFLEKIDYSIRQIQRQLAFTRDYQNIGVHSPLWQDVHEVIEKSVQNLDIHSIELNNHIKDVEVFADPLMEKVFFNLIDNAIRYGEKITRIHFYGEKGTDGYTIICEDNGVGIPDEYKDKIFNREYYKHTGFGLNLSREILSITELTIRECGKAGTGARFEIFAPIGKYKES